MSDDLLHHYEKELAFLRQSGAEFARQHPKIAGRLRLSGETVEDPHVSRLLEGVAYLNAHIQQRLDDDFPELTDALLTILYPHYQRPIPSTCISQFVAKPDLQETAQVPAGTALQTEFFNGESCEFRTAYPVTLQPLRTQAARLTGLPFVTPGSKQVKGAGAVLSICLEKTDKDVEWANLQLDHLRFYLNGQPQHVYPLYDLLLSRCLKIAVAASENDPQPVLLDPSNVQPVGFAEEEGLLPYPAQAFMGYRLLTELMAFPQKFLFFDLALGALAQHKAFEQHLYLYIYVEETDAELERSLGPDHFQLGCTPVVNLFKQTADPIRLNEREAHYHIVPDATRPGGMEVYSVDQVSASNSDGEQFEYRPFYGVNHDLDDQALSAFWIANRRFAQDGQLNNEAASEVDIQLVDLHFNPLKPHDRVLTIDTTCTNRNLPEKLPFGSGQPYLTVVEGEAPVSRIQCLTPPTPTQRPPLRNAARWRLLSHLSLNHLSLTGGEQAGDALKEILRLYDFSDSASVRAIINAILHVKSRPVTAPIRIDRRTSMCRGTEIELTFDPRILSGFSAYLFASVLERFFAQYCSINSFTKLIARIKGKDGVLKVWPPRAGDKALL